MPDADPSANNLLAVLAPQDRDLLAIHLTPVTFGTGEVIYNPGDDVRFVLFPCGPTLLAFRVTLEDGRAVETALVGREGALGGIVSRGRLPAFARADVQFGGPALRAEVAALDAIKRKAPALDALFARYADCLLAQIFQAVACNAAHTIEQRAAKWLISAAERTGAPRLLLTQDQLAAMLGVGRSYVTRVLRSLRQRGLVETRRGALHLLDAEGLERLACDCHHAVRRHFNEVLAGVYPDRLTEADSDDAQSTIVQAGTSIGSNR
ncbi:MAG: Crp/Fnr family transcriptional regulator [Sphingomonadaceae bacterium]|nr:Crp/Fnr family transcriptional regulator [Sphingomonadaceae bacterium]